MRRDRRRSDPGVPAPGQPEPRPVSQRGRGGQRVRPAVRGRLGRRGVLRGRARAPRVPGARRGRDVPRPPAGRAGVRRHPVPAGVPRVPQPLPELHADRPPAVVRAGGVRDRRRRGVRRSGASAVGYRRQDARDLPARGRRQGRRGVLVAVRRVDPPARPGFEPASGGPPCRLHDVRPLPQTGRRRASATRCCRAEVPHERRGAPGALSDHARRPRGGAVARPRPDGRVGRSLRVRPRRGGGGQPHGGRGQARRAGPRRARTGQHDLALAGCPRRVRDRQAHPQPAPRPRRDPLVEGGPGGTRRGEAMPRAQRVHRPRVVVRRGRAPTSAGSSRRRSNGWRRAGAAASSSSATPTAGWRCGVGSLRRRSW